MSLINSFWNKHGETIISVAKGAAIAAIGAGIEYAVRTITATPFNPQTAAIWYVVLSVGVNIVRKFGIPIAKQQFFGNEV